MENKRPISREKHVTDNSKGVNRRGSGLGTGPVGNGKRQSSGFSGGSSHSGGSSGGYRSSGGGKSPLLIIVALIIVILGGGKTALSSILGDSGSGYEEYTTQNNNDNSTNTYSNDYSTSTYSAGTNNGKLDYSVAEGSRAKYTKIIGDGSDTVTIMMYMCGTDLESKYGMATNDINEMLAANIGDKVNLVIYTGGCKQWKNSTISSRTNQIYQIKDNRLICLESDLGSEAMTKPSVLTGFIEYCHGNFPADRYELILWDHGGGSVSGYGYDEKYANSGSMRLSGIKTALADANVEFDFIGFDACLMATLENGLMLADYADYMIASEETEPGVGWYYTNWLTDLGNNTSISTLDLGKRIVDDFVSVCNTSARGQKTTLSVVDLAELTNTVPDKLSAFSASTSTLIKNDQFKSVANARSATREFSPNSKIDQVDLVNLSENIGTTEALELAQVLKGAVKYNLTSSNMTNANGISIYFPYRKLSYVDSAVSTYNQIGMDNEYSKCIKEYAGLETTGQSVSYDTYGSNYSSLFGSLLGDGSYSGGNYSSYSGGSSNSGYAGSDELMQLMGSMFFSDRALSEEQSKSYVAANSLDVSKLVWTNDDNGNKVIALSEDEWDLVTDVELNMFYDDGTGYVDLGLDNLFEFNDNGDLIAATDKTWIAINGQPVAYYHMTSEETDTGYIITGYVPAMVDNQRVNIILEFTEEHPKGEIIGVSTDYDASVTEVIGKNLDILEVGSTIDFICDYYSYDGEYLDSYYLGEAMEVTDNMEISNVSVGNGKVVVSYCFTDIYNNLYWSESIK